MPASTSTASSSKLELLLDGAARDAALPHVLLALDQFPRSLGGGERVALRIAELLPRYGFRASILALGVHPESAVFKASPKAPVYVLPVQRTYAPEALSAARELRSFIRSEQVRIVQTFFESSDLWTGPVAKLSGAKLIWSRRDMGILRQRKHSVAYRCLASMPDRVFAVSEQVRQHLIEVDGVLPDRIEVIYNGLDPARWMSKARPETRNGEFNIVTVGNIRRVKGHDLLIRAAGRLASEFPQARFQIAGEILEPEYYAELETLIEQLGLRGRFTFAGGITDLPGFLSTADLFVLPSRSEGFSNAIIEAMAAGLPLVATDVGGNAEAVGDGTTGRIVPPEDVDALTRAVRGMLENQKLARQMGDAGRNRVLERFTLDAMMRQITTAYRRLLR